MTTAASGFWISEPGPVAKSIGTSPRAATSAVISTGRGDEAADVASAHVALDDDPPLCVLAADLRRAFLERHVGELAERQARAARSVDQDALDRLDVIALPFGKPRDDAEGLLPLEDARGLLAADRGLDDVVHVRDVD